MIEIEVSRESAKALEEQLAALSGIAANLDGTCGEKTHAYMMDVLAGEDKESR